MLFIAQVLNVNKTTIYRKLKQNSIKTGRYNPNYVQELSDERKEHFVKN